MKGQGRAELPQSNNGSFETLKTNALLAIGLTDPNLCVFSPMSYI
jgi:hypothetical protein